MKAGRQLLVRLILSRPSYLGYFKPYSYKRFICQLADYSQVADWQFADAASSNSCKYVQNN